ncbi:MAG: mandelate racemase/muconate lactonizing enzyme family protein [bacterium]|nr:mandelate racemase/muconate lactonizing enzyme family protein [bacterium]
MEVVSVEAVPTSFPVTERVQLGVGTAVKKDTVVVKVVTRGGLVGWGESHHGRAPGAIAHLVNTTLQRFVVGRDAADVTGIWQAIYQGQLASHGMGAAAAMAMSGIDLALWDIRGKATGWPLYRLLGGGPRAIPAYAGGVALGYQPPDQLAEEARRHVDAGYRAVKLRIGDAVDRDLTRVRHVREALGPDVTILSDANTGYTVADVRRAMPGLEEDQVEWLEEPFPAHDHRSYRLAAQLGRVPLAAGENHYTRFEFHRLVEDGVVTILQPDLSKCGGLTEALRIAALASTWKLPIHPHTSMTGLNMAATIHFLASIPNPGYFEGDVSQGNRFRDELGSPPYQVSAEGTVCPLEAPGIGIEIDEGFLRAHPVIDGPSYV